MLGQYKLSSGSRGLLSRCGLAAVFGDLTHLSSLFLTPQGGSFARELSATAHLAAADYSYTPPGRHHLFVPGPCNINVRVERAMMRPSENHRDPHFPLLAKGVLEDLKVRVWSSAALCALRHKFTFLFSPVPLSISSRRRRGARSSSLVRASTVWPLGRIAHVTAVFFPSACLFPPTATGTGAWEAALSNTLSPGDKVVCFRYGQFSHLWIDQAQRLGLNVEVLEEVRPERGATAPLHRVRVRRAVLIGLSCNSPPQPWGNGANEERLKKVLQADTGKTFKAVMVVHNETTTGVTRRAGTLPARSGPRALFWACRPNIRIFAAAISAGCARRWTRLATRRSS